MDNKLQKIEEKLDKLDLRLDSVEKIMDRNTTSLEEHMRRSDLIEQYVQKEVEPIKAHVALVSLGFKGIMWACGALAGFAGFLYILKDLGILKI